jgi:uncharacterized protein (PEP-CTERM system associated)
MKGNHSRWGRAAYAAYRAGTSYVALASVLACAGLMTFVGPSYAQEARITRDGDFRAPRIATPGKPVSSHRQSHAGEADDPSLAPFVRGGWQFSAVGQVDLTFTDNAYLTATNKQSDFIVAPTAAFEAHRTSSKSVFDANVAVSYDIYTQATDLSGPRIEGFLDGTAYFADDSLSLRARVATSLEPSSYLGAVPATERNIGGNQVQILTYGLSPTFNRPVSDSILAEARYDFSGVTFVRAASGGTNVAASDSFEHRIQGSIGNRIAKAPLDWSIIGTYNQRDYSSLPSSQRATGEANAEYGINSRFAVLGRAGYEWIDEPTLSTQLSGPYAMTGFIYRPTRRSSLRVEAGYRYNRPNYLAELSYERRFLAITARFSQGVDTSQGFLSDLFGNAARDEFGRIVNPATGLPPDPRIAAFDFTNQAFRFSRLRLGIHGTLGRNFYNASGTYEKRSANDLTGESWSGQATLGRHLTRALTLAVDGRYLKTTRPTFVVAPMTLTETTGGGMRLTYQLNRTLAATIRYVHLKQQTTLVRYTENAAVLSLSKTF